ncbi:MAG TPA: prepilin peptidase [Acidimicrobiales bacterium]|jgi:leader peptidase (prepilin peptidase)/N-methyltransferase|nr:prepilin peptidase [Acidimicrobiales bacterium]
MTAFLVVAAGVIGLAVGSFLNVVIHRVPRKQSVVRPRSACPACGTQLAERDNVPLLSWLLLRGRCRTCGAPISIRYPLVELATAMLFVGAALRFGFDWALPAFLVFLAGLLALAFTDLEHYLLPVRIVYPVLVTMAVLLVVAAAADSRWSQLETAAAAAAVGFAVFFFLNWLNPKWMGFGDVRLAAVIGLGLGWLGASVAFLGFFLAFLLGSVVGVALIVTKRMDRKSPIPFGVFLAIGAGIAVFAGQPLVHLYLRH